MKVKEALDIELHEFWPEINRKIVRVRKEHDCNYCGKIIKKNELARCDSGKTPEEDTIISLYVCFDCLNEALAMEAGENGNRKTNTK